MLVLVLGVKEEKEEEEGVMSVEVQHESDVEGKEGRKEEVEEEVEEEGEEEEDEAEDVI